MKRYSACSNEHSSMLPNIHVTTSTPKIGTTQSCRRPPDVLTKTQISQELTHFMKIISTRVVCHILTRNISSNFLVRFGFIEEIFAKSSDQLMQFGHEGVKTDSMHVCRSAGPSQGQIIRLESPQNSTPDALKMVDANIFN